MNPVWGHLAGVFILVMMAVFIAIWAWAWLPRHKRAFGDLSRLPMEDQAPGAAVRSPAPMAQRAARRAAP